MKRNSWKFEYSGKALAAAADKQLAHRKERLKVWKKRKDEIMKEIREKGLTVDEGNARIGHASNNYNATMMAGPQVIVDQQLQANLAEAHSKVGVHQNFIRDYEGWVRVFEAHPEQNFKLNHDDWLHFFTENK